MAGNVLIHPHSIVIVNVFDVVDVISPVACAECLSFFGHRNLIVICSGLINLLSLSGALFEVTLFVCHMPLGVRNSCVWSAVNSPHH